MTNVLVFPGADLTDDEAPLPEEIEVVRRIYAKLRPRYHTAQQTLDAVLEILTNRRDALPPTIPADRHLLFILWGRQGWEHDWIVEALGRDLGPVEVEHLLRLRALREQFEAAEILRAQAEAKLHPRPPEAHRHRLSCSRDCAMVLEPAYEPTGGDYANWNHTNNTCKALREEIDATAEGLRRRQAEQEGTAHWHERVDALYEQLSGEYRGLGTVYALLCRRLAEVAIKIELGHEGAVPWTPQEYAKLRELHAAYINQIQKHTESTKSETVDKQVNEAVIRTLKIVEDRVASAQPKLWHEIVVSVKKALQAHDDEDERAS